MNIKIDYRETRLIQLVQTYLPQVNIENLIIGDIHISKDDTFYIFERKTLNDLSSSIIDGRYKEQKQRLLESNACVVYIIEGTHKNAHGVPLSTLYSAMFTMQQRDNIIVLRTFSIEETAELLCAIYKKIDSGILESKQSKITFVKKSNNADLYMQMLCCIPGISNGIAKNIINMFPSLKLLLQHINDTNTLVSVPKIGPKLSAKVVDVLLNGNK